ncbi:MAG: beta-ketoacyl-[acyl-carrier-protein] synthase family protein [Ferruginibacter sp.]|nr:beta-ketoacyl-[acyl-carrier-protein] synthase family protein [Ferruginibacter sp.]
MGLITAIGDSAAKNRMALSLGKCGISTLELFPSKYANSLPCGEIKIGTQILAQKLNATEPGITRTTLLALHAFEEAILDSKLTVEQLSSFDTALIGASTVGGMCLTDELYMDAQKTENGSEYINSYDCSSVTMYLQQRYKMAGTISTINTACSSSANAIMYGARLIKNGLAKRAIVGGADSLAKFTINGFNALHILSGERCTPFDERRKGLNLGEGAAFIVLEREEDIDNKKVYAELTGYFNSNDAFHPSSLSDEGFGPYLSMKGALDSAKLTPADIGFINAHGTGTENNDLVESRAMLQLFTTPPPFASTKSNIGHTLGAAGAIEAVYSLLNLHYQELYPGLNFSQPIAETGLMPVDLYTKTTLQHVMSNSFGFGGNCTSLIFSKS